jgi:hypothetical protein
MNKKWLWTIIIVIVILLLLGFLYSQGIITIKWQWLAVIFAGLAAPFNLLKNYLSGKNIKSDKILQASMKRKQEEEIHRKKFEAYSYQKEQRIKELEAEVQILKNDIDKVKLERKQKEKQIQQMSNVEDLQNAFMEGYNDES